MQTEFCLVLFSFILLSNTEALGPVEVKTETFLSPPFYLNPGHVANKYYYDIPFPKGHIALKSFNAEVVDESGNPVPLHEIYLHHWVVNRYHMFKDSAPGDKLDLSKIIQVRNSGLCKNTLGQYYGLGSETRKTDTWVPDPYGIVVGNPEEVLAGYEEKWMLNVHAIDTRGVTDRLGCTECRCGLYNVTIDEYGHTIRPNYTGGLFCCYDETQCKMREGFESVTRKLFVKYTVKWVDWEPRIVPVKIYILDSTDSGTNLPQSCKVEYDVKECNSEERANGDCVDTKITRLVIPHGGDIIYGVAHQHSGGAGSALYGQDGRLLCTSIPSYGEGKDAGNEANYIVGMTTCYPKPGSVKIADGETLTLISNYNSNQMHTGVMNLFYILVAEHEQLPQAPPKNMICFNSLISWCIEMSVKTGAVLVAGVSLISIATMGFSRLYHKNKYEALPGAVIS
ncbi:uncharacterized protein LOC144569198 [Carex rostrata]